MRFMFFSTHFTSLQELESQDFTFFHFPSLWGLEDQDFTFLDILLLKYDLSHGTRSADLSF